MNTHDSVTAVRAAIRFTALFGDYCHSYTMRKYPGRLRYLETATGSPPIERHYWHVAGR